MRPLVSVLLVSALPWLVAACAGDADRGTQAVITDSAGVRIVSTSPGDDVPLAFASERLLTLGGTERAEESFYRVTRANAAADGFGRLYVLDRSQYRVQVFDSTGQHLRALGRQGNGPGELGLPVALLVSSDGEVWVADLANSSFVHWGPGGGLREPVRLPGPYRGLGARWTAVGLVVEEDIDERHALVLAGFDPAAQGQTLVSFPRLGMKPVRYESCGLTLSGDEPIFAPGFAWTTTRDEIVVARTDEYAIDFYSRGTLRRSVRRGLAPRAATATLAEASLNGGLRLMTPRGERICAASEVVEQRGFAPYLPQLSAVALAPDGRLWVQRYGAGDASPEPIDIFDPGGVYVGTLPLGTPFPIGFMSGGRILVSERDELDVERLVVLRVTLG